MVRKEELNLEDGESHKLLELESELVPELLLVQIRQRIVPIGELRVRITQRFQVLQSSHSRAVLDSHQHAIPLVYLLSSLFYTLTPFFFFLF